MKTSLGTRIQNRRIASGKTLKEVVTELEKHHISISRAALSKYEKDKSTPNASVLRVLSDILNVKIDYFFKGSAPVIEWQAYRKKSRLTKRMADQIKQRATDSIENKIYLEEIIFPENSKVKLNKKFKINSVEEAEVISTKVRKTWGLGNWPIESITDVLESKGFHTIFLKVENKNFDGLSGTVLNRRVILIKENSSIDRTRLNLCHELGHHFIDIEESLDEQAAYRFAAAFLIPAENIIKEIGIKRNKLDLTELIMLKEKYGISVQALTRRLLDLEVISKSYYTSLCIFFRKNYWHKIEPGNCQQIERPIMFRKMLLKGIAENILTEDEAIELDPDFENFLEENNKKINWHWNSIRGYDKKKREKILEAAASIAQKDYENDINLNGFQIDDIIYD